MPRWTRRMNDKWDMVKSRGMPRDGCLRDGCSAIRLSNSRSDVREKSISFLNLNLVVWISSMPSFQRSGAKRQLEAVSCLAC